MDLMVIQSPLPLHLPPQQLYSLPLTDLLNHYFLQQLLLLLQPDVARAALLDHPRSASSRLTSLCSGRQYDPAWTLSNADLRRLWENPRYQLRVP